MTTFPGSPLILKAGIVLLDAETSKIEGVINFQYNPESITRSLRPQAIGAEGNDRSQALRLSGPPVETISFSAEIDATDQLEFPDENADATEHGIQPQLAALETMVYPASADLQANHEAAAAGNLEIAPVEAPLSLLVWSKNRVLPVRVSSFSISEQAFDRNLNPIRAKVEIELRVLNVNDLGFEHKGGSLFMVYQQQKEALAKKGRVGTLTAMGIAEENV